MTSGIVALLAGGLALSGCSVSSQATASGGDSEDDKANQQQQQQALRDALDEYSRANPGLITSVSVSNAESTIDYGEQNHFETASIVKVEILVRWLTLRQNAALPEEELELAERMITASDNEATTELCEIITGSGEPDSIPGGTNACVTKPGWGTDETDAKSQRLILESAFDSSLLNDRSRATLEELMGSVEPQQAWGISAASNDGEKYWLKNGWDVRDNGWVAHSDGVIETAGGDRMYMAVLTDGNASQAEGIAHVEEIARLAREAMRAG